MLSTHLDKWKIITGYMEKYLCGNQWKVRPVYVILARETFIAEIFAGFPEKTKAFFTRYILWASAERRLKTTGRSRRRRLREYGR